MTHPPEISLVAMVQHTEPATSGVPLSENVRESRKEGSHMEANVRVLAVLFVLRCGYLFWTRNLYFESGLWKANNPAWIFL